MAAQKAIVNSDNNSINKKKSSGLQAEPLQIKKDISGIDIPTLVMAGAKMKVYLGEFNGVFHPAQKYISINVLPNANNMNIVSNQQSLSQISN